MQYKIITFNYKTTNPTFGPDTQPSLELRAQVLWILIEAEDLMRLLFLGSAWFTFLFGMSNRPDMEKPWQSRAESQSWSRPLSFIWWGLSNWLIQILLLPVHVRTSKVIHWWLLPLPDAWESNSPARPGSALSQLCWRLQRGQLLLGQQLELWAATAYQQASGGG